MTQVQTTVSATPPPAAPPAQAAGTPPAAAGTPPAGTPTVDAAALQRRIDELTQANREKDQAIEFLQEKAKPAPAKTDPEEDDTDILDVITSKGGKGLDELLTKRGFARKDEVEKSINAKASELAKERELMEIYPDLADKNSEFFKSTAINYGHLLRQEVSPNVAMEMAVERTALAMMREGKIKTPREIAEEKKTARETERRERISAQGGDRGVRGTEGGEDDEDLSPVQKRIAAAMGITEEAYKLRAKKGVAMRGVK